MREVLVIVEIIPNGVVFYAIDGQRSQSFVVNAEDVVEGETVVRAHVGRGVGG